MATDLDVSILWRLPQELLDMVFDFAYPAVENLQVTRRSTWEYREERKRRSNEKHCSPSFVHGVDKFFVSKRFFKNAIRAWVSSQHWISNPSNLNAFGRYSIFEDYATEYADYAGDLMYLTLDRMPRLQFLRLRVGPDVCMDELYKSHGYAWMTRIPREAFRTLPFVKQIAETKSIRVVQIAIEPCSYAGIDPVKMQHWQSNMEELSNAIQDALRERDLLRKKNACRQSAPTMQHDASPCSPVVSGSKVCLHCSGVHFFPPLQRLRKSSSAIRVTYKGFEPLVDADIPVSQVDILRMVNEQPSRIAHWIWKTKKGLTK